MKFIQLTTSPSQNKRDVLGTAGERERLLTVLYYDLNKKAERKTKGHHDDESESD